MPLFEVLSLQELHGEVEDAAVLAGLENGDDVLVLERCGKAGLAEEALAVLVILAGARPHHLRATLR